VLSAVSGDLVTPTPRIADPGLAPR